MLGLQSLRRCHDAITRRLHHTIAKVSKLGQPSNASLKKTGGSLERVSQLMLRQGIIQRCAPGLFSLLPLGVRALDKLSALVTQEMEAIGGVKINLPVLTQQELWEKSGRFSEMGRELMTLHDRHSTPYVLSPTHEEAVCSLVAGLQLATDQLPLKYFQITSKFRDEARPRHALLRSREFVMKDLYSFDANEECALATYDLVTEAYNNIFETIGIPFVRAEGSVGDIGGLFSHEYHFPSPSGQDTLLCCLGDCGMVVSADLLPLKDERQCPKCGGGIKEQQGIEVGHTFLLGKKYSLPLKANYTSASNRPEALTMGCYGLGLSRILQATLEVTSQGGDTIVWPWAIAPYKVCIIGPKRGSREEAASSWIDSLASAISTRIAHLEHQVIIDDRTSKTIGRRVNDAKASGYPLIVVVGKHSLEPVPKFELINNTINNTNPRQLGESSASLLTHCQLFDVLSKISENFR